MSDNKYSGTTVNGDVVIERYGLRVTVAATEQSAAAAEERGEVVFTRAELDALKPAAGEDGKIRESMFKVLYAIKAKLTGSRVTAAKGV